MKYLLDQHYTITAWCCFFFFAQLFHAPAQQQGINFLSMILARYQASIVPTTVFLLAFFSIAITYLIAVHLGHVKPWPYTDITHCAIHYPERHIFRIGLMIVSVLLFWNWQLVANWLREETVKQNGNSNKKLRVALPVLIQWIGGSSGFFLALSTGTIDTDDMPWTAHVIGATGFFILSMASQIMATVKINQLYKKNKQFVSFWSLLVKIILNVLIGALIALQIAVLFPFLKEWKDALSNVVEWGATLVMLLYNGSFAFDWHNSLYTSVEDVTDSVMDA